MKNEASEEAVKETPLESWERFAPYVAENWLKDEAHIFRGQMDARWKLESRLDRLERRFRKRPIYGGGTPKSLDMSPVNRGTHLRAFQESARGKRPETSDELSEEEWWAIAQHHGLATPLLDWTYSPFVALFFAFEEEGYVDRDNGRFCEPESRAVFSIPFHYVRTLGTQGSESPEVFSVRRELTHRLSTQVGLLMKMPKETTLESLIRKYLEVTPPEKQRLCIPIMEKIVVPSNSEARKKCLQFLNKMNINRASLFPDLDGAAAYVNALWELDFATPLGRTPNPQGGTSRANRKRGHRSRRPP